MLRNYKKDNCKKCNKNTWIYNKSKGLCRYCNAKRLHSKKSKKRKQDNDWYESTFNQSTKVCEECGISLQGYSKAYVSHILSKGAFPEFRYEKDNINILCFDCHQRWEFKDKENMTIYPKNKRMIELLKYRHQKTSKFQF